LSIIVENVLSFKKIMVEAFESLYNNDELVPFQQELHELNDRIINDLPSSKPLSFE
jgi:hypothetical protein